MSHKKYGLKALGLTLVAALGLMAFLASSASANFRIEGTNIAVEEPVSAVPHSDGILKVPALNLEILCKGLKGESLVLLPGAAAETKGKLAFSECISRVKGVEQKGCLPLEQPIKASGKGKVILHTNSKNYVLFEPNGTEPFAIVKFNEETCTLPPENKVKGSLVAECVQLNASKVLEEKDCATEESNHLLRQAPQALFPSDKLLFGANESFLEGTAKIELAKAGQVGKKFSGTV